MQLTLEVSDSLTLLLDLEFLSLEHALERLALVFHLGIGFAGLFEFFQREVEALCGCRHEGGMSGAEKGEVQWFSGSMLEDRSPRL